MTAKEDVRLIRPEQRSGDTLQTSGMTREVAIASDRMWSGLVRAATSSMCRRA